MYSLFDYINLFVLLIMKRNKKETIHLEEYQISSRLVINKGEIIDIEDIMIGAIVIHNGERLVTRNKKHFERIRGLEIEG